MRIILIGEFIMSAATLSYSQALTPRLPLRGVAVVASIHIALIAVIGLSTGESVVEPVTALSVRMLPVADVAPNVPQVNPPQPMQARTHQLPPTPMLTSHASGTSAEMAQESHVATRETQPGEPSVPEPEFAAPRFDAAYLDNPAPTYPPLSRRLGEEGKVLLRVLVEADGRPARIEIKTGSGSERLDQAAEHAVRRWRFVPAKQGSEAVSAWVVVPITFNLRG